MIIGFLQTSPKLKAPIRQGGCALLCAIYLAPKAFSVEDVNAMYEELLQVGFIEEDCTIYEEIAPEQSWEAVLNSIAPNMHFKSRASISYVCKANEREILKWYLSNVDEDHFTVGNGASKTLWDSMNRPDVMSQYATFTDKVIVRIA